MAAKAKLGQVLFRSKKKLGGHQAAIPAVKPGIVKRRRKIGGCDLPLPAVKSLKSTSSNVNGRPIRATDDDHQGNHNNNNKSSKTTPSPQTPLIRETTAAPPPPPAAAEAAVEIQLSRSMALRAAMLKVRYADTISKASQKLGNPDNTNRVEEEEEAMRRRRRLQVEREREAARIAVDKIQKTVEFNDAHSIMIEFHNLICSC